MTGKAIPEALALKDSAGVGLLVIAVVIGLARGW